MVQLRVLSGKKAGAELVARRFPVRIGRSPASALALEEPGVWDQHLRLDFERRRGYIASAESDALMSINGEQTRQVLLRNGDIIGLGSVRLQFWLAECRQARLGVRETLTWLLVGLVCLSQVGLIYYLLLVL